MSCFVNFCHFAILLRNFASKWKLIICYCEISKLLAFEILPFLVPETLKFLSYQYVKQLGEKTCPKSLTFRKYEFPYQGQPWGYFFCNNDWFTGFLWIFSICFGFVALYHQIIWSFLSLKEMTKGIFHQFTQILWEWLSTKNPTWQGNCLLPTIELVSIWAS